MSKSSRAPTYIQCLRSVVILELAPNEIISVNDIRLHDQWRASRGDVSHVSNCFRESESVETQEPR